MNLCVQCAAHNFNEAHLYYPEISNIVKPTGVFGIFKGFKGISKTELEKYETIFEELKEQYPNNMIDKFNIYEPELRKEFNSNDFDLTFLLCGIRSASSTPAIVGCIPD